MTPDRFSLQGDPEVQRASRTGLGARSEAAPAGARGCWAWMLANFFSVRPLAVGLAALGAAPLL
ncbi:hypothetical protein [Deinococcus hohokamensis]|uniref:Uncharacterized protein n=1 Tax=Deinococcus hohokamensis TaxID=309883 RepID=A0ABV9IB86_9DEIO